MNIIGRGAEAILYRDGDTVVKDRISKSYRHPTIDKQLRGSRTRREAKVMERLDAANVPAPRLTHLDDANAKLSMTFLDGPKLRDVLHEKHASYAAEIGKIIGQLHANNIIHSDLTTSNMLVVDGKLHLIDFGLSFFSHKPEDKATDLKLLQRALESKHHEVASECFELALEAYAAAYPDADAVLKQLSKVQLRGRNKQKAAKDKVD